MHAQMVLSDSPFVNRRRAETSCGAVKISRRSALCVVLILSIRKSPQAEVKTLPEKGLERQWAVLYTKWPRSIYLSGRSAGRAVH